VQFKVSPSEVADMAGRLVGLKQEFDGLEDQLDAYRSIEVCGHDHVAGKLGDFADNWSDKKRDMAKKLEELSGYAHAAADAYAGLDGDLSDTFEQSGGGARRE
jgi:hypothetical protein